MIVKDKIMAVVEPHGRFVTVEAREAMRTCAAGQEVQAVRRVLEARGCGWLADRVSAAVASEVRRPLVAEDDDKASDSVVVERFTVPRGDS